MLEYRFRQILTIAYVKLEKRGDILAKEKEFIFPMNYKKKEKFLGFIDYKTLGVIGVVGFVTFSILRRIEIGIAVRVSIFIIAVGFFSILMLIGVNGESMLDFLYFIMKYLMKEKVYVYRKTEEKEVYNKCESLLKRGFR